MPNQLVNLQVKEVSGVDSAANMRKFLVVKSATPGSSLKDKLANIVKQYLPPKQNGTAMTFTQAYAYETIDGQLSDMMYDSSWALRDTIKSVMKDATIIDKLSAINQALSEFHQVVIAGFANAMNMMNQTTVTPISVPVAKREEGEQVEFTAEVLKSLPEDVRKGIEGLQAQVSTLQKAAPVATEPKEEDIFKGMSPAAVAAFKDLQKRAQDAEDIAKAEREARLNKEYLAKASSLTHLGVKPEDFGQVLKSIGEANGEALEGVLAVLKAANEAIATSGILKEVGNNKGEAGDAWGQIEKAAAELRKSDSNLSPQAALNKAMEENPALYEQYKRELMG